MLPIAMSGFDPQKARAAAPSRDTWLQTLGDVFTRVVLFAIEGTTARVTGVRGLSELLIGTTVPLVDQTPLRWAIEAASPIVGAGRSPSGEVMSKLLSLAPPAALSQLAEFQGRIFILYLNNLPFINEKGAIFYPTTLFSIPPKEFIKAKKLARPVTPG